MKSAGLAGMVLLLALGALAGAPASDKLLDEAMLAAATAHKTIFVHFGASWCGWCGKLEGFLERTNVQPVFEKYFVPVSLVVREEGKNKARENPGADKLLEDLGGTDGIPFFAFLDAKGKLIVNSMRPGATGPENTGFPVEPAEVDWFVHMLREAAPRMTEADRNLIVNALRNSVKR